MLLVLLTLPIPNTTRNNGNQWAPIWRKYVWLSTHHLAQVYVYQREAIHSTAFIKYNIACYWVNLGNENR